MLAAAGGEPIRPGRGPENAPVQLVAFVDYASPYCRRMEPVLQELLARYPDAVRLEVRHSPLPVHRDARGAAVAAECALEQGLFWPFHEALLGAPEPPLPGSVGADPAAFELCLRSPGPAERVDGDLALAAALRVRVAPTYFVNETRLDGPQTLDALVAAVAAELDPGGSSEPSSPPTAQTREAETRPPRERVVRLARDEVERALADRAAFAAQTELAPLPVQGHRLVRLARVPEGSLLARMQLEPRDLLMQIDGDWLVDRVDPFADALLERQRVRVTIIRRGFPKTFVYEIE